MPPRKSDASKAATGDEATPVKDKDTVNVEDLSLPRTMVQRLAKGVLPPNTQIQKDAVLAMSKSATVFVNYLTTNANDYTLRQNKRTIMPKDVFEAIVDLEFQDFMPRLEAELAKYNEVQTDKRNTYRKKVAADKAAASGTSGLDGGPSQAKADGEGESPPAAKKARRSTAGGADMNDKSEDLGGDDARGPSGDETISEDEIEPDGEEEGTSEEEIGDIDGEEAGGEEDALETLEQDALNDEALDNGEDSD